MIRDLTTGEAIGDYEAALRLEDRSVSGRPWVMLNMVTSIDGATTFKGGSTPLSDDDDRALFHAIRGISDVILVGSGTVEAEDYKPDHRMTIVSGRLSVDPARRVFGDPDKRPTVIGSKTADPARISRLEQVADLVLLDDLSGSSLIEQFPHGSIVLCEGGPTLNSSLFTDGVVDEINWTVSPHVVLGDAKRMTAGDDLPTPTDFRLDRAWMGDESLFLRYVRS